jgi:hypothetical protein
MVMSIFGKESWILYRAEWFAHVGLGWRWSGGVYRSDGLDGSVDMGFDLPFGSYGQTISCSARPMRKPRSVDRADQAHHVRRCDGCIESSSRKSSFKTIGSPQDSAPTMQLARKHHRKRTTINRHTICPSHRSSQTMTSKCNNGYRTDHSDCGVKHLPGRVCGTVRTASCL